MLSNFFNNLFKDKKKPEKPEKKSGQKASPHNSAVDKQKSVENTTWLINGHAVPVEVHRERRNNVRVSFGKDKLILRTSLHLSAHDEATAVAQLKDAVTKQIVQKPELLSRFVQKIYKDGDILEVGKKTYFVHIETQERASHSGKFGKNGAIHLRLSSTDTEGGRQKAIPTLLSRIISQDCSSEFSRRVLELNHQFFRKDIKSINFKYNHSNWGSCSSSGNLNFSSRLLFAPDEVQDYVIIHELAHLIELNHSDKFWKLVSDAMPDYDKKEKWLKKHGHEYRF